MNCNYKNNTEAFSQYLQSMVKLEELEKMTEDLDKELEDSQKVMSEIKTIFDSIPNLQNNNPQQFNELRREDAAQFLVADAPQLLMPDMTEAVVVDLDNILAGMKTYAEDIKKNIDLPEPSREYPNRVIEKLDLAQYASSLDELSKRLANIKLNKNNAPNQKNADLEAKLNQLCEDVNNFTQMVHAKTKISMANETNTASHQDNASVFNLNELVDKLIAGINEVTYLLKNRK